VTSARSEAPLEFAVIGAQRARSTHLVAGLRQHPAIALCRDEVPYFEDPFYEATPPSELARVFRRAQPGQRRGIHRPEYLAKEECAPRIRADAPDARLLAVLREPVQRAVSAYHWYVQFGRLPLVPAEAGLSALLDGWSDPAYPHANEILEYGRYGRHLGRYLDHFPREQLLVLRDDELDSSAAFVRAFEFLGVPPRHEVRVGGRTNSGVYDTRRLRWLRLRAGLAPSWDRETTYRYRRRRLRRPVAQIATSAVVAADRIVLSRLLGDRPPVLSSELRRRLGQYYQADVGLLASTIGIDTSPWRRADQS
jgi:hypothetical protein